MSNTLDTEQPCIFCRVVAGDIPADIVLETPTTVAFRDVSPQAPTHVLVIPRRHEPTVVGLLAAEPQVVLDLVAAVGQVADQEGLGAGYRTVFNTGAAAQQSVPHAHVHVLGGRSLSWPPG